MSEANVGCPILVFLLRDPPDPLLPVPGPGVAVPHRPVAGAASGPPLQAQCTPRCVPEFFKYISSMYFSLHL